MRVRRRDGTIAEVDAGYILRDGESVIVAMALMDSARSGFHDAGERERVLADAYAQYDREIGERWRSPPQGSNSPARADPPRQAYDSPAAARAAVDAAYAQYNADIQQRWRGK